MKFSTLSALLATSVVAYVDAESEYYAGYEPDIESLAGTGVKLTFEGCASALTWEGDGDDAQKTRSRFVEVLMTDSTGKKGMIITPLETYVESIMQSIEQETEVTCQACPEFDVMGDYNEDWYDLCTQHGYSMKDAYGYEDWMSANCDEDCLAEIEEMEQQMAYEENANEDEAQEENNEEEQEGDNAEEEQQEEGGDRKRARRLRALQRMLSGDRSIASYDNRADFCKYCAYDCGEDGPIEALKTFQEAGECRDTEIASQTIDEDGEYVNYKTQMYCNPNTKQIKLGVFSDETCSTPLNVDIDTVMINSSEDEYGNVVTTQIPYQVQFDLKPTISCDQVDGDSEDDQQLDYLVDEDAEEANDGGRKLDEEEQEQEGYGYGEQENNNNQYEVAYKVSETCEKIVDESIGCVGNLYGYYSKEMQQQCELVQEVMNCESGISCTFTNIDLRGENYPVDEGSDVMSTWAINSPVGGSSASKGQKVILTFAIPLTALFAVAACYYHGKLSSSGKNAALSGQGGAMA